ncbi:MAG: protein-ribulosamine 3-kinase [Bacteroidia bacterium]|jgi:protein-ribulosamine 3-kinase
MFETEARSLGLLIANSEFEIPKPILINEFGGQQFLVMDWMEQGQRGTAFSADFGKRLAGLHKTTRDQFGLDHSNYVGLLPQSNASHSTWAKFYWAERLLPQIKLASKMKLLTHEMSNGFDRLKPQLESIFPIERPSLIHGDLWRGNYSVSQDGKPCIFDPAVYFGHREMDLAMMQLFGGFDQEVFESYNESFPLEPSWEDRLGIGQLYPLMVHVNLFGASYCNQVERILSRF